MIILYIEPAPHYFTYILTSATAGAFYSTIGYICYILIVFMRFSFPEQNILLLGIININAALDTVFSRVRSLFLLLNVSIHEGWDIC